MKRTQLFGATVAVALLAGTGLELRATRPTANIVIEWNQILQDTIPGAGGVMAPRFYSMVHIAMFDAVNAIEREYTPYRVRLRDRGRGSPEAAAAQAAHDVLVALNRRRWRSMLRRSSGSSARRLPSSCAGVRRSARGSPRKMLAWRQNDGWMVTGVPPYVRTTASGALAADAARITPPRRSRTFRTRHRWRS